MQQIRFVATRLILASVLGTLLGAPATSLASSPDAGASGNYRGQCRQLSKQIKHYEYTILPLARERGNAAWARATEDQVERLWHRRADLCPAYGAERTLMARAADRARKFNQFVASAARAAAAYFSGGVTGGM